MAAALKLALGLKSFQNLGVSRGQRGWIKQRFAQLGVWLDERTRRLWAAAESAAHGRGGISLVARASGVSRRAIAVGLAELQKKPDLSQRSRGPIRQKGAIHLAPMGCAKSGQPVVLSSDQILASPGWDLFLSRVSMIFSVAILSMGYQIH